MHLAKKDSLVFVFARSVFFFSFVSVRLSSTQAASFQLLRSHLRTIALLLLDRSFGLPGMKQP